MHFPSPLIPATLLRRYKRFLADVVLPNGEEITVHVANPGAMTGLAAPGGEGLAFQASNPAAQAAVFMGAGGSRSRPRSGTVGVNTAHPNPLVGAAIAAGTITSFAATARCGAR